MAECTTRRDRQRMDATLLLALIFAAAAGLMADSASRVTAQPSGTQYTLTMADNGATLNVQVGDSIALQLGSSSFYRWDVRVSDVQILRRPPVALIQGVQGLWNVIGTGQATITATGTPTCYPQCLAPSYAFSATIVAAGAPLGMGATVTYAAGWNLAGVPLDTTLPVDAFGWDPLTAGYITIGAGAPLKAGRGYWAYFAASTQVRLLAATTESATFRSPPGAWVLVGDPSDVAPANVSGADLLYTWDAAGQGYVAATALRPGQGAWAYSSAGGQLTVSTAR
jgi:hypothetical protein